MSTDPKAAISRTELVALLAMLAATVAFSVDAMLPALPDIADAISPDAPNRAQLVISSFVVGLGLGTLFTGPLSDTFGRRPIAAAGAVVYIFGALIAAMAPSIELHIAARFVQGFGAAGPRVVSMAITRDLFKGRQMARIMSFVMIIFTIVPVIAPSMGAAIAWAFGWRAIFVSFAIFSVISTAWLLLRLSETLAPENRRPFRPKVLWAGVVEVTTHKRTAVAIAVQTLIFSMLFLALISSQQIFDISFGRGATFPLWFGAIAAVSASAALVNAALVVRYGMRQIVRTALAVEVGLSLAFVVVLLALPLDAPFVFAAYIVWQTSIFFMANFGIGNMNALAMEPMGHIAGMAASIIAAAATILAMVFAVPVGLAFNGTPIPAAIGGLVFSAVALILIRHISDVTATEALPSEQQ